MSVSVKKAVSVLSVLLLLILGCGMLTACGNSASEEETAPATEAVTEEQSDDLPEATQAQGNDDADGCIDNEEDLLY